jgi:hypothetical protein
LERSIEAKSGFKAHHSRVDWKACFDVESFLKFGFFCTYFKIHAITSLAALLSASAAVAQQSASAYAQCMPLNVNREEQKADERQ